jgi:hypothetical protein
LEDILCSRAELCNLCAGLDKPRLCKFPHESCKSKTVLTIEVKKAEKGKNQKIH